MAFILGNLVGRFLMSALIVWIVMMLIKRFDMKLATASLKRPLPILSVFIVFVLGLVGSTIN